MIWLLRKIHTKGRKTRTFRSINNNGFFTLATNLDIMGLIFAIIVFCCGFWHLSNKTVIGSVRSVELLGIFFASTAIFLMWYNFNRGRNEGDGNKNNNSSPT
jgi:D-alanyl-lipoteichoic acid acyltransferase DltB (MBOAT superfamily)